MSARSEGHQRRWNPDDPSFKCCCNTCHVKTGTMVIGVLESVCVGLNAAGTVVRFGVVGGSFTKILVMGMVCSLVWLTVIALLFYGLNNHRSCFLIPHMVVQIASLAVLAALTILILTVMSTNGRSPRDAWSGPTIIANETPQGSPQGGTHFIASTVVTLVFCGLVAAVELWWFLVILACYRFFRKQELNNGETGSQKSKETPLAAPPPYPGGYGCQTTDTP